MGKGSKQRPRYVDMDTFNSNWIRVFKQSAIQQKFWDHVCLKKNKIKVFEGEACKFCGQKEEDE